MAEKQKKSFRKEYLNDFHRTASGEYVYCGQLYDFESAETPLKRYLFLIGAGAFGALILAALPECLPPTAMSRSFWTILPWLLQAAAVFLTVWQAVRILFWNREMRAYVHDSAVKRLPLFALLSAIFAFLTLVAQAAYLLCLGAAEGGIYTFTRVACSTINGALCLFYTRFAHHSFWRARN